MESIKERPKYICQMVGRALEKSKAGLGQVPNAVELGRLLFFFYKTDRESLSDKVTFGRHLLEESKGATIRIAGEESSRQRES